jgi:hypothetical protein
VASYPGRFAVTLSFSRSAGDRLSPRRIVDMLGCAGFWKLV